MQEITLDTKIADLLNNYKNMQDILIDINPKFKKLNNPILRRTLAKVAGVKQAAIVGNMEPLELLNQLRVAAGQAPVEMELNESIASESTSRPNWTKGVPISIMNANDLLDQDKNPLAIAHSLLKQAKPNELILIISDFRPEPLLDEFKKTGYEVYCHEQSETNFLTYIKTS